MKTTQNDENRGELGGSTCWSMTGLPLKVLRLYMFDVPFYNMW